MFHLACFILHILLYMFYIMCFILHVKLYMIHFICFILHVSFYVFHFTLGPPKEFLIWFAQYLYSLTFTSQYDSLLSKSMTC